MKKFLKNTGKKFKRAETILEVLVAIFVVAIGSGAATSLVIDALNANGLSRDNLIAMNLAVEGIEAVRNIRDGNWIKYSYDRENCWNMVPDKNVCDDADLIQAGQYTPYLDTATMGWKLVEQTVAPLDLGNVTKKTSNENFKLEFKDLNTLQDSNGDTIQGNDPDLYVAKGAGTAAAGPSRFYRMVTISYPNNNPANDDTIIVTSVVQWQFRGYHQIRLVSELTNYNIVKR